MIREGFVAEIKDLTMRQVTSLRLASVNDPSTNSLQTGPLKFVLRWPNNDCKGQKTDRQFPKWSLTYVCENVKL